MRKQIAAALLFFAVALAPIGAWSQTPAGSPPAGAIRVFVDCNYGCDETYLRQEVTFVDYMRDRSDADVHILLTTQDTGGGCTEYTIKFIGLGRFKGVEQTLKHVAIATSTFDEQRKAVTELIKQGLVRYVAESPLGPRLRITIAADAEKKSGQQDQKSDPWKLWVFTTEIGGSFSGEKTSQSRSLRGYASANRTTEALKVRFSGSTNYRENSFDLGDEGTVTATSRDSSLSWLAAKSLTPQWSAALVGRLSSSTFVNQDFAGRFAGGAEYDFFPYSESTRRLLTLQYTVGVDRFDYKQETIYGKLSEQLLDHRLQTSFSMRQPWGSSSASAYFSQYLTKPDKYSITVYGDANVRLFKGFSFNLFGEAARTRDQLYLARGEASTEEILVRQRQLETGYRYFMHFGISYSFGSIFNNVVNPRFGG